MNKSVFFSFPGILYERSRYPRIFSIDRTFNHRLFIQFDNLFINNFSTTLFPSQIRYRSRSKGISDNPRRFSYRPTVTFQSIGTSPLQRDINLRPKFPCLLILCIKKFSQNLKKQRHSPNFLLSLHYYNHTEELLPLTPTPTTMERRFSSAKRAKAQLSNQNQHTKLDRGSEHQKLITLTLLENALTLIGRVINPKEHKSWSLIPYISRRWNLKNRAEGSDLGNNCFQFRFDNEEDLQQVLDNMHYLFNRWMVITDYLSNLPITNTFLDPIERNSATLLEKGATRWYWSWFRNPR